MGGTTVLERLATLEATMAYLSQVVSDNNIKLDKLADLVDIRITAADTRTAMYSLFGKYGAWVVGGLVGVLGGTQFHSIADLIHKLPVN